MIDILLHQEDWELAYRKLLEAVIDTRQPVLYREALKLTELKFSENFNGLVFKEKALSLMSKVESHGVSALSPLHQTLVTAQNITKLYKRGGFKLNEMNLTLRRGDLFGLVGENGNGKTTLLRILAAELEASSGVINYEFSYRNNYDLRTKLVYIPQRIEKRYGSIIENLQLVAAHYGVPPEENELEVLMTIARLGLWNYRFLNWDELSSGYKMRFELARTLLRQPDVLFLDEPLANLDILAQQTVLDDLKHIAKSASKPIGIILSSQQLYEVERNSDFVFFLKKGILQQPLAQNETKLAIEIETTMPRLELQDLLSSLNINSIKEHGGLFIISFGTGTTFFELLELILKNRISFTSLRDISKSKRRFF
jgi:ABC-2 type transport system ATP-binding protein